MKLNNDMIDAFGLEDNEAVAVVAISEEEAQVAVESFVEIAGYEASIEDTESGIAQIETQIEGLHAMSAIATASVEDNTVTPATVKMLSAAMEASAATLGLPTDMLGVSTEDDISDPLVSLNVAMEEKDSFIQKMVFAIKKLYAKISGFVKKMFLKTITTLNFNKSSLENLTKALEKGEGKADAKFEDKTAKAMGAKFGTLAVLSGKTKEFKLSDVKDIEEAFTAVDKLKMSEKATKDLAAAKTPEDALKIQEDFAKSTKDYVKLSTAFIKNYKNFNVSDSIEKSFTDGVSVVALYRFDGVNVGFDVTLSDGDKSDYKYSKGSVTKDVVKDLKLSEVPSAKETLDLVNTATKANTGMKATIDETFKQLDAINKNSEEVYKNAEDASSDKGVVIIAKKFHIATPSLAMGIVMNEFKTIRNIIALGNAVVAARELKKDDKKGDEK